MIEFIKSKSAIFRHRLMIAESFGRLKRQCRGDISLVNEYTFKKSCAAMLETCGFVPDGFITDTTKIIMELKRFDTGRTL